MSSGCAEGVCVLQLHRRVDSRAWRKSLTHSEQTAGEQSWCSQTGKRTKNDMSIVERLAELARLTVESIVVIVNETGTSPEGSVKPQNSTISSGKETIRKYQMVKEFLSLLIEVFGKKQALLLKYSPQLL